MLQGSTRDLSDGHDQMRVKIQTPKSPWTQNLPPKTSMPNFRDLKFPESIKWYNTKNINIRNWMCTLLAQLRRRRDTRARNHESKLFRIPKKSLHLNQTTQKNTCQIILPKTFRNRTFQTQEHPSIIVVNRHLKSGVPALPPPPGSHVTTVSTTFHSSSYWEEVVKGSQTHAATTFIMQY